MAALVGYSSSEEEEPATPPGKKRKLSSTTQGNNELPPLPAAFLDQYSSTVRTSAQDDPSLHGGRKRVTPHVQGNWPTHVYLEWHPDVNEARALAEVVSAVQDSTKTDKSKKQTSPPRVQHKGERETADETIHSLLENELAVAQPLHISLSRPLTLKTEQKDAFLSQLQNAISESNVKAFHTEPKDLAWHSNENSTRWFLVLRLQRCMDQEMLRLLETCNEVANEFGQPLLYASIAKRWKAQSSSGAGDMFHVSVAWSLKGPRAKDKDERRKAVEVSEDVGVPYELLSRLGELSVRFGEVKVRIGQDVHTLPLKAARGRA